MGDEQEALWNGVAGRAWVDLQDVVDRMFERFADLLADAVLAEAGPGARVLDVGCGTGGTTLAVARRLGPEGRCTGVDISAPMIASAQARAAAEPGTAPARFVRADAQTHAFDAASFDMFISRFGVMFFADPVRAFANLRGAARDGAGLRFAAWRAAAENPFMTTATRAAAPLLGDVTPAGDPDAPGQFAFADRDRVARLLRASGWVDVEIRPVDVPCVLPEAGLTRYLTRFGPLGRILHEVDHDTRVRVVETVRAAFDPYVHGDEVRYVAACWLIGARSPGAGDVASPS